MYHSKGTNQPGKHVLSKQRWAWLNWLGRSNSYSGNHPNPYAGKHTGRISPVVSTYIYQPWQMKSMQVWMEPLEKAMLNLSEKLLLNYLVCQEEGHKNNWNIFPTTQKKYFFFFPCGLLVWKSCRQEVQRRTEEWIDAVERVMGSSLASLDALCWSCGWLWGPPHALRVEFGVKNWLLNFPCQFCVW